MHKHLITITAAVSIFLFSSSSLSLANELSNDVNEDEEFEGLYDPFDEPDPPVAEIKPPDLALDNPFYKPGFHAAFGLGYQFIPHDSVSSGYHYFNASAQGGFISIDLGYHWEYFALSANISPRAAWLIKDAMIRGVRLTYSALNKGDWDGYFMSIGIKADFIIPLRETMFTKFGLALDFPLGNAPSKKTRVQYQMRVGIDIGLYWRLNDSIALGFDVALRGRLRNKTPYYNTDIFLRESKRTTYFEPMLGIIYHP